MAEENRTVSDGTVCGEQYRFTVLTPRLIRMEYAPDGMFEDRPTQVVASRDFAPPPFRVWRDGRRLELHTEYVSVFYDGQPFSAEGLWAENRSECGGIFCTWRYGDPLTENLGGTARTLDMADGPVPLEPGIQSRLQGFALLDDSRSFALTEDGWFAPRAQGVQDLYFFSYGYAYREALCDFYRLCGATPLLPRYALGNWWSRYHTYTADEYLALMDRFAQEDVPLSVAVVDMDWHVTQPQNGGKGWTGYTWNRDLFPDPPVFLNALHARRLKTTLNLHPAEGVQAHEAMYPAVAKALGKDAAQGQRIPFDPGDRAFMQAYFSLLHHPLEAEGVDFWWVDWQQGTTSALRGLDPLWALNHLHTRDSARGGKRALILSRYAGPGSHRYPVGFSGDSVISWASLRFQPYFTATAANIGYGWWSHDIGGHANGSRDDELQVRWLQFGVFSPIMRLHSTRNPFCSKEPWRFAGEERRIMGEWLRLRHRLIPYLYTLNWRCHTLGEPPVLPMYYDHPRDEEAYRVPNQYRFGPLLTVVPVTERMDAQARLAPAEVWLPEGEYFDIFTGLRLRGGRRLTLWRALAHMPVLAKAGAILPMCGEAEATGNGAALPAELELRVYGGADGAFTLYEDDGETLAFANGERSETHLSLAWREGGTTRFTLRTDAYRSYLPAKRAYTVAFYGVANNATLTVANGCGEPLEAEASYNAEARALTVRLADMPYGASAELTFREPLQLLPNAVEARCEAILNAAQMEYELKQRAQEALVAERDTLARVEVLLALHLPEGVRGALLEVLLA